MSPLLFLLFPSAILLFTTTLPPPTQPYFSMIKMFPIWMPPTNSKKTPLVQTFTSCPQPVFIPPPLPPSPVPSSMSFCLNSFVLSSFCSFLISSPSSMVLWPSCGPRCLWPADMSRLHSTVLHCSVSFPCSLPLPFFGPAAPPAVSKERYATLPLYSFRYVIILSSPFLLLLLPCKVGMSCLMMLALF